MLKKFLCVGSIVGLVMLYSLNASALGVKGGGSFQGGAAEISDSSTATEKPKRIKVYTDEATVKKVQEQLNDLGYNCGTANGINNEETQKAISDYQRDYGLVLSGSVNEEVLQSLENRKITEITDGMYKVGQDILAGEYIVFASDGSGYFSVSSDSNQEDILFNENFDYNSIITVNDGEYLKLERCYAVPFAEVDEIDLTGDGMFKVGTHIPAGEYKLDSGTNLGYYCIYSNSRQQDIIANDNFEGQNYVTVSDGQYLVLDRCKFAEIPEVPEKTYSDAGAIQKVQQALNNLGYDCGAADGIAGEKTQNAIKKYQQDNGLTVSGEINEEVLQSLDNNKVSVSEGSVTKDIHKIMEKLPSYVFDSYSLNIKLYSETEEDVAYIVNYKQHTFLVLQFYSRGASGGADIIVSVVETRDETKLSTDYVDLLANLVQSIDSTLDDYDGYTCVVSGYDAESYSKNGIKYFWNENGGFLDFCIAFE